MGVELGQNSLEVQVMGAVNVHRLWPSLGSVHGGTLITMMGDDLGRASAAGLKCLFDKVAVSEVKAISSSSLACTSPVTTKIARKKNLLYSNI